MTYPLLRKNDSEALVDWSSSFLLYSKLLRYQLIKDGVILYSGVASVFGVQRSSPGESKPGLHLNTVITLCLRRAGHVQVA